MPESYGTFIHFAECFEKALATPGRSFGWQWCDSPIEDIFFHKLHKFANPQMALRRQHDFNTDAGTFRVDFCLSHRLTGRMIVIECDGRDFHSVSKDSERDKAIMRTGRVAEIYRFAGKDIFHREYDVFQLLANREPWIAMDSYRLIADRLSHPSVLRTDERMVGLEGGYEGVVRTYFEWTEEDDWQCECEDVDYVCDDAPSDPCPCLERRERHQIHHHTPTIMRFMTDAGRQHPSPLLSPKDTIAVPQWKQQVATLAAQQGVVADRTPTGSFDARF